MSWPLGDSQAGTLSSSVVRAEANVMLVAKSSGELRLVFVFGHFFFLRCRLLRIEPSQKSYTPNQLSISSASLLAGR
jgi:hypothetical protein